jgi:hypothetical protein
MLLLLTFINLPDSTSNEAASHGYVTFEVDPISDNLPHNTVISNEAEIYFDYNPAIVTNSCLNTVFVGDLDQFDCNSGNLILEELVNENEISVYPNPANDFITIHTNSLLIYQLEVFITDLSGKLILHTFKIQDNDLDLNLISLEKGTYILMIRNTVSGAIIQNSKIVKI